MLIKDKGVTVIDVD